MRVLLLDEILGEPLRHLGPHLVRGVVHTVILAVLPIYSVVGNIDGEFAKSFELPLQVGVDWVLVVLVRRVYVVVVVCRRQLYHIVVALSMAGHHAPSSAPGHAPQQGSGYESYERPGGSHEAVAQCGDHERRTRGQGGGASCGGHTSYGPRHGAQPRPHLHTGQRAGRGGVEGGAGGEQQDQQDQGGQGGRHHSDCQYQTDTETVSDIELRPLLAIRSYTDTRDRLSSPLVQSQTQIR